MRLTNEQKSEVVAGFLGFGNANAKSRVQLMIETGLSDREVRRGIQSLRRDYPVVKSEAGYFIANPADPTDRELAEGYYAQEYQRMRTEAYGLRGLRAFLGDNERQITLEVEP